MKMMKITVYVFVAFAITLVVSSPIEEAAEKKPGYCLIHGEYVKEGDGFVPAAVGYCQKVKCSNAANNEHAALTCALHIPPKGCHLSEKDLTKRYPGCCPKTVCDDQ